MSIVMGIGRYKDGKFDLIVSFRYGPDIGPYSNWAWSFQVASRLLFEATNGQLRFDRIFVAINSAGSSEADAWLLEDVGTSTASFRGLGLPDAKMALSADEQDKPYVIVHEFGHYGLGLWDEYLHDPVTPDIRACTGSAESHACIMEFAWDEGDRWVDGSFVHGRVREFCTETNHNVDPSTRNYQQEMEGQSCWNSIVENYTDLSLPASGAPVPDPSAHTIQWIHLETTPRYALVVDKSNSMADASLWGAQVGAWYWLEYLAQVDEYLTVIAYDDAPDVILPLRLTGATDRDPIINEIFALSAGGTADIGGGLRAAAAQIESRDRRAATQVIVLFSDGLHDSGTPPEDVIEEMVESGIRLYTIGFGPSADQERLEKLARSTRGRFWHIDPSGTIDDVLLIASQLIEFIGEIRDGTGIVTTTPELLAEPTSADEDEVETRVDTEYDAAHVDSIAAWPDATDARAAGYDHPVYIEKGSRRATFVLTFERDSVLRLFLVRPDNSVVDPETATYSKRVAAPSVFYVVDNPAEGEWVMRVSRGQAQGKLPFKVSAFSDNKKVNISLRGDREIYEPGDVARFEVRVSFGTTLTGLATAIVREIGPDFGVAHRPNPPQKVELGEAKDALGTGIYKGVIPLDGPGTYTFELQVDSGGQAFAATSDWVSEFSTPRTPVPAFQRVQRFQVRVRHRRSLPRRFLRWVRSRVTGRRSNPW